MEIRKPKFELGQKVVDKNGDVETVLGFNSYHFENNEYWYDVSYDEGTHIKKESFLEPYVEKPKSVWDLKSGDKCYFVTVVGHSFPGTWNNLNAQIENRKLGNVFLTKQDAEYELERRRIENDMLRLGGRRKAKKGKTNWFLEYRPASGGIEILWSSYEMDQGVIYFDSEEKAEEAVEIIGEDRIKKYIFGVES